LKLHIVARGKMGRCPEAELIARYQKRIGQPLQITELPDTGGKPPAVTSGTKIVALHEKGEQVGSTELANMLGQWRDASVREVRFLIGAADGLSDEERRSADRLIAFGRVTWPHMLVRAMLVEQLYRATSIIAGHPYHREG
jgi:23S rRNA (pseudouridine1915-N3)-methyltransferase